MSNREVSSTPGLSRRRASSRRGPPFGVLFARRASPLLASLASDGGSLGRARVLSRRDVLLSFLFQIIVPIARVSTRTYIYFGICSAGYAELPIVLLYLLRCLVYHSVSM